MFKHPHGKPTMDRNPVRSLYTNENVSTAIDLFSYLQILLKVNETLIFLFVNTNYIKNSYSLDIIYLEVKS